MSDISQAWNENLPSDGSIAVRGRQEIVDFWQAVVLGLESTIEFPGGALKEGASKTHYGTSSAVSYAAANAKALKERFMVTSDITRMVVFDDATGSQDTQVMGSLAAVHSHHTAFVNESPSYWASISGQTLVDSTVASGTFHYTYNGKSTSAAFKQRNAQFASPPTVIVSSSNTNEFFHVTSVDTFTFDWAKHSLDAASNASIYWHAHGPQHTHRATSGAGIYELL